MEVLSNLTRTEGAALIERELLSRAVDVSIQQFRLTTESGVSVSTSDRTAQNQIHLTPHAGNQIALWDGSAFVVRTSGQVSLTLTGLTNNTNYDYFPYWDGSAVAIEIQAWRNSGQAITGAANAGPIVITANSHGLSNGDEVYIGGVLGNTAANGTWIVANATTNTFELTGSVGNGAYTSGTGLLNARVGSVRPVRHQGVWTKNGDPTRRLVGTFRTTGTTTTEDSLLRRYVANVDNLVLTALQVTESTDSWTYSGGWRQVRTSAANQVEVVVPLPRRVTALAFHAVYIGATNAWTGVGLNSTSAPTGGLRSSGFIQSSNGDFPLLGRSLPFLTAGYSYLAWLERSSGSVTFTGDNTAGSDGSNGRQSGLQVEVML